MKTEIINSVINKTFNLVVKRCYDGKYMKFNCPDLKYSIEIYHSSLIKIFKVA
jgi:N12 class adenine-specific DNA methylase